MGYIRVSKIAMAAIALLVSHSACAAISDSGLLNDVTQKFLDQSSTWSGVISRYATWLFWTLATINMVWTFGMLALRKADVGEFFSEFIRFTVTTGFFWWLLANGPAMAMAIINSLRRIGAEAGGLPVPISPSTPISIGFDIVKKAFTGLSWVHPIDNLGIVLISAAVVIAMAVVAANVLIALVTAWVMAYAGIFILGLGGARWTSEMAIGYFKAMLGVGMELMTMTLLVAIAVSVVDGFYRALDGASVYELLLVLCVCVVLALLIDKIPKRVAALVGGGSGAGVGAGHVIGAGAMAAAAMAAGGAAVVAGAASAAGGAQALMAAVSKANSSVSASAGMGAERSMGVGAASGPSSQSDGGAAGSSFAAAMGDSGANSDTTQAMATAQATSEAAGMQAGSNEETGSNASAQTENTPEHSGQNTEGTAATESSTSDSPKSEGTMSAAGALAAKMGKVAVGTAVNLAQGSWDVGKAKYGSLKDSAFDRISNTTGGKIAAAIKAREAAAKAGSGSTAFDENSLSAGRDSADAESEVAAFRERDSKST